MPTPREAYTNTVEQQGYSNARVRPVDFGQEQLGRAVAGFGQDVGEVAKNVSEIEKRDAETAAQEADNVRLANRLKRYYEGPEGFFNQQGRNAITDAEKLQQDLKRIDEDAATLLKGKPWAQRLFSEMTNRRNTDDMPRIAQFVNTQRKEYEKQVDTDAFDLAIDNATSAQEPEVVEANIVTAGNLAVRAAMREGRLDNNSIAQARQAGVGKAVAAVAARKAIDSPLEAQAFVKAHVGDMDPQEAVELLSQLAPSAAKEEAGEGIGRYLVTVGGAPAAAAPDAAPAAAEAATELPDENVLMQALWGVETPGGRHRNADGSLITSPAGARGTGQIMPATGPNPGYGVKPLQNSSEEEHKRFSRDLLAAYTREFGGNVVLGLTAYNWGPGNLRKHMALIGADPSKGQISDAAFVNSIPVKEAREYAPKVLARVGVSVAGAATVAAPQVAQGVEVDLDATYQRIEDDPNLTFAQKEAFKSEASRRHSLGRQVKAEAREALEERVATHINNLPVDGFTDFDKLPLDVRRELDKHPELALRYRQQAEANERARLHRIETANNEARTQRAEEQIYTAFTLQMGDPDAYLQIDFHADPRFKDLTTSQRMEHMRHQQSIRNQRNGKGDAKGVNYEMMRREINRYIKPVVPDGKVGDDKKQREQITGRAYEQAYAMAQAQINAQGGKPLEQAQYDAIAKQVTQPVTITYRGGMFNDRSETIPRSELARRRGELGDRYKGGTMATRDAVRANLQMIRGRPVSDAEVDAAIREAEQAGAIVRRNRGG